MEQEQDSQQSLRPTRSFQSFDRLPNRRSPEPLTSSHPREANLQRPSVLELIRRRLDSGSRPGHRQDPYKLALTVEGGGMRGVVTGGMVGALEMLDMRNVFDIVYGASGGAPNAAYFVAGQAVEGMQIYLDYISGNAFIDVRRLLVGKPLVDLQFLYDQVITHKVPLNWEAVVHSAVRLKVLASRVSSPGDTLAVFEEFESREDLLAAMHASSRIPIAAGLLPYHYRDGRYWDANIIDRYGISAARQDDCSHVLILQSRTQGARPPQLSAFERFIVAPYIRMFSQRLGQQFLRRFEHEHTGLAAVMRPDTNCDSSAFMAVAPDIAEPPARLETNRAVLYAGALSGFEAILRVFGRSSSVADKILADYRSHHARIGPLPIAVHMK